MYADTMPGEIAAVFSTPAMMDNSLGTLAMAFKDYATGLLESHRASEAADAEWDTASSNAVARTLRTQIAALHAALVAQGLIGGKE